MVSAIGKAEKVFCCVVLAVMVTIAMVNVVTRYVLHIPLPWSEELIRFLFLWFTMVGASLGIKTGAHIGISVITDRVSPAWRTRILVVGMLAMLFFAVMLFYASILFISKQGTQTSPAMELPMLYVYGAFPVGAVLMSISLVSEIFKMAKGH